MTTRYNRIPAYDVIAYLWNELQAAEILDATDYYVDDFEAELIPIVPVQDLPQMRNYLGDKPYLVYEVLSLPIKDGNWFIKQEQILFTVYSPSFNKLVEICTLAEDALNRLAETGDDITQYMNSEFTFHCFETQYDISGPTDSEGGRMYADITTIYEYTRDLAQSGRYLI